MWYNSDEKSSMIMLDRCAEIGFFKDELIIEFRYAIDRNEIPVQWMYTDQQAWEHDVTEIKKLLSNK